MRMNRVLLYQQTAISRLARHCRLNMGVAKIVRVTLTVLPLWLALWVWLQWNEVHYKTLIQTQLSEKPRGIIIDPPGNALERYEHFSDVVLRVRGDIWRLKGRSKPWNNISEKIDNIMYPDRPYFFDKLSQLGNVRTLYLSFAMEPSFIPSMSDDRNLIIQKYYELAGDPKYCEIVTDNKIPPNMLYSWIPHCSNDRSSVLKASSIHKFLLNPGGIMQTFIYKTPLAEVPPVYVTYISFVEDAIITSGGSVISQNYKIYTQSSLKLQEARLVPKEFQKTPLYDEVLSFAQIWTLNVYHNFIQGLQRVIPYLKLIRSNPQIMLHTRDKLEVVGEMLHLLGIKRERLCYGTVRAKLAYIPEGINGMFHNVPNTQLLSHTFRQVINKIAPGQERRSVIFIKKTETRHLIDSEYYENMVENVSKRNGLNLEIFPNNPISLIKTMKMFDRAVMVIALPGAGSFNMIFCRPGTYFIEVTCADTHIGKMNVCYMRLAHILGLRYYGHLTGNENDYPNQCNEGMVLDKDNFKDMLNYFIPNAAGIIETGTS